MREGQGPTLTGHALGLELEKNHIDLELERELETTTQNDNENSNKNGGGKKLPNDTIKEKTAMNQTQTPGQSTGTTNEPIVPQVIDRLEGKLEETRLELAAIRERMPKKRPDWHVPAAFGGAVLTGVVIVAGGTWLGGWALAKTTGAPGRTRGA